MTTFDQISTNAPSVIKGNTFFKVTEGHFEGVRAPKFFETSCQTIARHAVVLGHKVQSFSGRQGRRITNTKAGI